MVNTNTKEFREKVQAHIRNEVRGQGGLTAMFRQMESLMRTTYANSNRRIYPTPYASAYYMVEGGDFLIYNSDILKELHRWGLTDDRRLENWRNAKGDVGEFFLYAHLMAREMERMYEAYQKEHARTVKRK